MRYGLVLALGVAAAATHCVDACGDENPLVRRLSDAREEFDAAVATATEDLKQYIEDKIGEAQRKGDLDLKQVYEAAMREVERGDLPKEPRVGARVKQVERDLQRAKKRLLTDLKDIEREYVKQGDDNSAVAIRKESEEVEKDVKALSARSVAAQAPALLKATAQSPATPTASAPYTNSIGMVFVSVPQGDFDMDQKKTRVSKPFLMSVAEVTQQQWEKVMGTTPWKGMPDAQSSPNLPATYVSHADALTFCDKLTRAEQATGGRNTYRLPTQVQWVRACLGGVNAEWCTGANQAGLETVAWYILNTDGKGIQPTRTKGANRFGLYDMHGNVAEWCLDGPFSRFDGGSDPQGHENHPKRVTRGGYWRSNAAECGASSVVRRRPEDRDANTGFRVITF